MLKIKDSFNRRRKAARADIEMAGGANPQIGTRGRVPRERKLALGTIGIWLESVQGSLPENAHVNQKLCRFLRGLNIQLRHQIRTFPLRLLQFYFYVSPRLKLHSRCLYYWAKFTLKRGPKWRLCKFDNEIVQFLKFEKDVHTLLDSYK
jgi:hypothetical protein